ncbi:glycosyltransferase family 2 protein [Cohnella caldifontis]|uniref:glycosyltransferase family 2 protein n=1 Tax=Cohnella caldifontis TaxID=3027471 RepID=UPI0023ED7B9D|nr:glycosyltransferase family 2 protein [Cohnella sp. YIM B05605]
MSAPLVSIVMLCWNRIEDVRESLNRIREQHYPHIETIVVDNGSTDGTVEMIQSEFPGVRLIRMYKNMGIEAYNIGFANARGEYTVIIDDDSFPAPNAIRRMVDKFEADERLGVVAFDVRNFYSYDDIKKEAETTDTVTNAPAANDYFMSFNGAGAGVRTSVLRQIGGYPEEFFLYNNELDSAFRIWDAGYKIQSFPDVVAYHKYSPKNRTSWRAPFYYTRNAFWTAWKNYPADMALRITIQLIYSCLYYSMEQRTTVYLKAMWSAFRDRGRLKGKRKPVERTIAEQLRVPWNVNFTFYR